MHSQSETKHPQDFIEIETSTKAAVNAKPLGLQSAPKSPQEFDTADDFQMRQQVQHSQQAQTAPRALPGSQQVARLCKKWGFCVRFLDKC